MRLGRVGSSARRNNGEFGGHSGRVRGGTESKPPGAVTLPDEPLLSTSSEEDSWLKASR